MQDDNDMHEIGDDFSGLPESADRGNDYRLIHPDGTFNIERVGSARANIYETVLEMSWMKIMVSFLLIYLVVNAVFGGVYMMIGSEHIAGVDVGSIWHEYVQMVFFSTQTFTTVGYGHMSPEGTLSSLFSAFVAFIGLISFAILTGLSFAKFSRPSAHLLFSDNLLIAPNVNLGHQPSLQFRVVNATNSQIIDLQARVTLTWLENIDGVLRRKFMRLDLEFDSIHLFPLNWTIVHTIDEESPLYGQSLQRLMEKQLEVLVLVKGFDDVYSQTVHSKKSYSCADLIENARFVSMYQNKKNKTILDLSKISQYKSYEF